MNVSMTEITEAKAWAIVPSYIGTMNVLKILFGEGCSRLEHNKLSYLLISDHLLGQRLNTTLRYFRKELYKAFLLGLCLKVRVEGTKT